MYFKKFTTKQVALFSYFNKAEAIEASRENRHTNGGVRWGEAPAAEELFIIFSDFTIIFVIF